MKVLLDTCTFLWIVRADPHLSATARAMFADPANTVYLSAVSAWEIVVKHHLGRLPLASPPHQYVPLERKNTASRRSILPRPPFWNSGACPSTTTILSTGC